MTFHRIAIALAAGLAASSAYGEGDIAAGEQAFNTQCQTCHVVVDGDGNTLAGRAARTGPNLYNAIGRTAGIYEGFRYSRSMVEAGEAGLVWDEPTFIAYALDPTGFLREYLDSNRARGNMAFRVRTEEDAANLYAFLAQFAVEGAMEDGAMEEEAATESN